MELDNPFWHAMIGRHSRVALGHGLARRYPANVSLLAAVSRPDPDAYGDLALLVAPGEMVGVFGAAPAAPQVGWDKDFEVEVVQMVCSQPKLPDPAGAAELGEADVPAMLELADATRPGPLAAGALSLGRFFGVWEDGHLVAMAGERAGFEGYTEICTVCTAVDHRRHGLAGRLISRLVHDIMADAETPFLHVAADNATAIRTYTRLGFEPRARLWVAALRRGREPLRPSAAAPSPPTSP